MTSPIENTIYNFTSPQNILRDHLRSSLLAYQTQSMFSRQNGGPFRRPRPRSPPKDNVNLLDTYMNGPPIYPSYLEDTIYSLLVEEQYNHFCQKYDLHSKKLKPPTRKQLRRSYPVMNMTNQLDPNTRHTRNTNQRHATRDDASSSSSSSASSTTRSVFFEELDTTDKAPSPGSSSTDGSQTPGSSPLPFSGSGSFLKYNSYLARLEYQDLRLPTAWSATERGPSLDLGENDNEIIYKGIIEGDASSVRSNFSVKPQCGLFYYEVKIEASDEQSDGHISIGFCDEYSRLDRLPGSDEYSWAYHGENGYLTGGKRSSLNTSNRKYGACFGIGDTMGCGIDFSDKTIFYTRNGIHLGTAFRHISGKRIYPTIGFKTSGEKITANFGQQPFVFDIDQYRKDTAQRLVHHIMTSNETKKSSLVDDLVANYLSHAGYMDTFTTLKKEMANGMDIHDLTRCGKAKMRQDICTALRNGEIDQVLIQCEQHYPDMMKKYPRLLFRLLCQKFMVLAASVMSQPPASQQHAGDKRTRTTAELEDDEDEGYCRELQKVLDYGRYLHQTYRLGATTSPEKIIQYIMDDDSEQDDGMADVDIEAELEATFSVLAYLQPSDNPNAYLCGPKWRDDMASELNAAILVTEGELPESSLERLYRQTTVTMEELVLNGHGQASMVPAVDSLL